ncbi:Na+/H+ antiporter subunit E [Caloramator sp. mosi_1]|uniref:Na+/H+ antiporter subunit E n=1 Tax=Caloramator sp. mosi_1 TaxID=3023090 RepID=UPI0023610107|nr:Na+/H+ antiporter subunit E [Caloramator sp. mosi_1]WDC84430.1 Na+/H+ antiporter subunit E [Caloramator sp. mosi_1]
MWSALSYPLTSQEFIFGLVLSFFISVLIQFYNQNGKRFKIKSLYYLTKYFIVFLIELVKANLNMARIVVTPSLPISPKIYEVKTELKSNIAKALLANSITLTPGTISVDLDEDVMYIHVVEGTKVDDVEELKGPFEKF